MVKKRLTGPCGHCGRTIEYMADLVGTTMPCPYCGQPTELVLATPPEESSVPKRALGWTIAAVVILVLGLGASFYALKRAQRWNEQHVPQGQR
jgi:hypothetical protein